VPQIHDLWSRWAAVVDEPIDKISRQENTSGERIAGRFLQHQPVVGLLQQQAHEPCLCALQMVAELVEHGERPAPRAGGLGNGEDRRHLVVHVDARDATGRSGSSWPGPCLGHQPDDEVAPGLKYCEWIFRKLIAHPRKERLQRLSHGVCLPRDKVTCDGGH
jgi:hypothetical protein